MKQIITFVYYSQEMILGKQKKKRKLVEIFTRILPYFLLLVMHLRNVYVSHENCHVIEPIFHPPPSTLIDYHRLFLLPPNGFPNFSR